jgi:GntR family transcriptional regulator
MRVIRGVVPLYRQIAQILRSQIHAKEYKAGQLLPTEDEMIRIFGVSRITVRQALQPLITECLIYRIAGKGTFVTSDRHMPENEWAVGSIEEIITASYSTKVRMLDYKTIPANAELARKLQIPEGTDVMLYRGLRFVDGEPFFDFNLHVPCDLAAQIPPNRFGEKPLIALIEECCHLQIYRARQWTAASLASSETANLLKLTLGDPVLLIERHYIDANGRVVGVTIDRYRTELMRHYLEVTRRLGSAIPHSAEPNIGVSR